METQPEIKTSLLTREQRVKVYEEEVARLEFDRKRRVEEGLEPLLSDKAKAFVIAYSVGCALRYFKVEDTVSDLIDGRGFRFRTNEGFFWKLGTSAVELFFPLLDAFWFGLALLVLCGIAMVVWKVFKKYITPAFLISGALLFTAYSCNSREPHFVSITPATSLAERPESRDEKGLWTISAATAQTAFPALKQTLL